MDTGKFCFRTIIILFLLILWAGIIVFKLINYTVIFRDVYCRESEHIAWREGAIPVVRGRILDAGGTPLAWTELHHDLILTGLPSSLKMRDQLLSELEKNGFKYDSAAGFPYELKRGLSPELFSVVSDLCVKYPVLSLSVRLERRRVEYAEIREKIGTCILNAEGLLFGIDGLEQQHNSELTGSSGLFAVMLDKHSDWLMGTLRIVRDPVQPKDVRLGQTLKEMMQNEKGGVHGFIE